MSSKRHLALVAPPAPASEVRLAPSLAAGPGERRDDCHEYAGGCLARWARTSRKGQAHCPAGCASFEPITREERMAETLSHSRAPGPTYHQPWGWGFEADGAEGGGEDA